MTYIALILSLGIILYGAEIFTNSIEWLGKKLRLGEGAVGSILAAVGTALPETLISVIAICFGDSREATHIGIGTILGAPLMLATLAMLITGIAATFYKVKGKPRQYLLCNTTLIARDLQFFLLVYFTALGATFLPFHRLKQLVALFLLLLYLYYVYHTVKSGKPSEETRLDPLLFNKSNPHPPLSAILFQVTVALLAIIIGANYFVKAIAKTAAALHIPAFILAIVIAPIATELPEKFNSIVWIRQGKDTLALGNITGAMVFQSSVIPALGILLTPWKLSFLALASGILALLAAGIIFYHVHFRQKLRPQTLIKVGFLYLIFLFLVIYGGKSAAPHHQPTITPQFKHELSAAQALDKDQPQLITVLLPGLSLRDIPHSPALTRLSQKGAMGLMNTQNNGPRRITSAYLSLSAGKRAACLEEASLVLQNGEVSHNHLPAAEFFSRYTGTPTAQQAIFVPYLQQILNSNPPEIRPGLLGEILQQNNIPLLLLGNQDLPEKASRPAALMAMNEKGLIRQGFVDQRTSGISTFSPTVYTTNYAFLYRQTVAFLQQKGNGIVLLDLGDLARLDSLSPKLTPEIYQESRQKLLAEIDSFLDSLLHLTAEKELSLLLLTPFPSKNELTAGNSLTPVLYYQPKMPGNELLFSAGTKRKGLLTNLDIAPTILKHWGIPSQPLFPGFPLLTTPHPQPLSFLNQQLTLFLTNYAQRPLLIKTYVLLLIILVLSLLFLFLFTKNTKKLHQPLSTLLLSLTSIPLTFLLLPLLPTKQLLFRVLFLLAVTAIVFILFRKKSTLLPRLTILYLATAFAITLDLLLGAPLMQSSVLGYDPISGARYYGLGNEYLGVLLGSSLLGFTLLLEILQEKRGSRLYPWFIPLSGLCFLFLIILVAAPQFGTNVGGAITFFTTYLLLFTLLYRQKLSFRFFAAAGMITLVLLLLLFAWDLHRPLEAQSHIGQTARLIEAEGPASLLPIFARKISMNLKLIRYSLWSRVFLTFLGALALIFNRPPGLLQKLFGQYRYLQTGFYTGLIGSFIILAVNDSGIVAAGTSMLFIAPTLLYLVSVSQQLKQP